MEAEFVSFNSDIVLNCSCAYPNQMHDDPGEWQEIVCGGCGKKWLAFFDIQWKKKED